MRRTLATLLLALAAMPLLAQQPAAAPAPAAPMAARAELMFGFLRANLVDSLCAAMSPEMAAALPRELVDGAWQKIEQQTGPYSRHADWTVEQRSGYSVCTSAVSFQQVQLSLVVSFDAEGRLAGLRLMPSAPDPSQAAAEALPDDAVAIDDVVTTDTIALPCTVTLSSRSPEPPMVVMVHGSGPLDRNETVMANATFSDLARQLAERGIASLRYDKRTYVYPRPVATMDEETTLDALSALRLARTYSNNVFLLGHSLGAMMAPVIAARTDVPLGGIVMMAAPARDLIDVVADQLAYLAPADSSEVCLRQTLDQLRRQSPHYLQPQGQVEAAQALSLPMLLQQGGRDYQVTMTDYRLWQQALDGHANARLRDYPELNHLFLAGRGKSTPQEYMQRGSVPAQVVDDIANFILSCISQ